MYSLVSASRYIAIGARGYACRVCAVKVSDEKVKELFVDRKVGNILQEYSGCKKLGFTGEFGRHTECDVYTSIERVSLEVLELQRPTDVIAFDGASSTIFLETLFSSPDEEYGDRRGDHGLQVSAALKKSYEAGLFAQPRSLVDIGGLNTTTLRRIESIFGGRLESLLIEISRITPALVEPDDKIRYAIGDVATLLTNEETSLAIQKYVGEKPTLFIMDNFVNVHPPKDAWDIIEKIWKVVVENDHVFLLGLHPSQLETVKRLESKEVWKGIEAYHFRDDGRFYKSVIHPEHFSTHLVESLPSADIVGADQVDYEIVPSLKSSRSTSLRSVWFLIKKQG